MKLNQETGMYETRKFIAATNHEIVGTGKTRDEAKADLKNRLKEYRNGPPVLPVGEFASPGFEHKELEDGIPTWEYNADRKGTYWARPSLAEELRERHKEAEGK